MGVYRSTYRVVQVALITDLSGDIRYTVDHVHAHIPDRFAAVVNAFTQRVLSPCLDWYRSCVCPTEELEPGCRIRKGERYAQK